MPLRSLANIAGRARWLVLIVAAGLLATALYLAFIRPAAIPTSAGAPRDPRLDYDGPFRNVDPVVRYVSDESCAECHRDKADSYSQHPMGRSLLPIAQDPATPRGKSSPPFNALGSRFQVERAGEQVRHRRTRLSPDGRPAADLTWDVHYALGSGTRGRSYLTDREGYLYQTPISWYAKKEKGWDLSPGFGPDLLTGRAVVPECLFCHSNRAAAISGSVNRYARPVFEGDAIGCQRCHGPGELHVRFQRAEKDAAQKKPADEEDIDRTIVNPRHLEHHRAQAVCEQCHLTGAARVVRHGRDLHDFRPGLPLESVLTVFVNAHPPGAKDKAVNHVEQMYQSRCFQAGTGRRKLKCVSCHNPHVAAPSEPERQLAYYRGRCQSCHRRDGEAAGLRPHAVASCRELPERRQARQDNCVACHMPPYQSADIPHTASTDHRIRREPKPAPREDAEPAAGERLPVVSFYDSRKGDPEDERDHALALVKLALNREAGAFNALPQTLPALAAATRRDPNDWGAAEAYGHALGLQSRWADALDAFQTVLAKAPDREAALVGAAAMAEQLGKTDAARTYWRRAVVANPWSPEYRRRLVLVLIKKQAWDAARSECQEWIRLDPMSAEAGVASIVCLLAVGQKDEARKEMARIESLAPPNLREIQNRFRKKLR
jgi:tetratricopeptide (TPR) repeat protein